MTPEELAGLLSILKDVQNSRFLSCVALTLAIYDWALVFPDELDTILQAKWTVPKALYYFIRIVTPIGVLLSTYELSNLRPAPTAAFCVAWAMLVTIGMIVSVAAANALLALRLVALYRRKPVIVWFIRIFFVLTYAATLGIAIQAFVIYYDSLYYSELVQVCATHETSHAFPAVFYGPAAFEFFVFALTAWRGIQDADIITGTGSAPFLKVLYRDGFICFFVMISLRVWNIWIYLTQPLSSFSLGTLLMWSINTILTTRVYMNLVWLAKKPLIETTIAGSRATERTGDTGIRMKVHTFTEAHGHEWTSKRRDTLDPTDDIPHRRRF